MAAPEPAETPAAPAAPATLLFIAGEKSGAGKSTVALGIVSALLANGFTNRDIAVIKPATQ
jgi:hypothetical protein